MAKLSAIQLLRLKNPEMTKDQAAALVSCRNVYVNGELCPDSKQLFPPDSTVEVIFPNMSQEAASSLRRLFRNSILMSPAL